jgi:hypothetical protein
MAAVLVETALMHQEQDRQPPVRNHVLSSGLVRGPHARGALRVAEARNAAPGARLELARGAAAKAAHCHHVAPPRKRRETLRCSAVAKAGCEVEVVHSIANALECDCGLRAAVRGACDCNAQSSNACGGTIKIVEQPDDLAMGGLLAVLRWGRRSPRHCALTRPRTAASRPITTGDV